MEKTENNIVPKEMKDLEITTGSTKMNVFTTIDPTDIKTLYNIDNGECDFRLNDCKGQSIRVMNVFIKNFDKYKDDDGNVLEYPINKKITILIDDQNKTYVTSSKMFAVQMLRFIERFGNIAFQDGLDIKIIEKEIRGSKNKGLGFELV